MRFQIDPLPGESQRACRAIVQAALLPSRLSAILIGLYVSVALAAFVFTRPTWVATLIIGVAAVMATAWAIQFESRTRLRLLQSDDPHALETHFIELGPEGVRIWCAHIDARYPCVAWASDGNTPLIPWRQWRTASPSEIASACRMAVWDGYAL